jgi:hypothetical protein
MKKSIADQNESKELLKLLQEERERNDALQTTILKMAEQLNQLQHRLDKLLQLLYGTKSEKLPKPSPNQPQPTPSEPSASPQKKNESPTTGSNANGRRPLPADLPRVRAEHDVPENERGCDCCSLRMQRMGKVVTEQCLLPVSQPRS